MDGSLQPRTYFFDYKQFLKFVVGVTMARVYVAEIEIYIDGRR